MEHSTLKLTRAAVIAALYFALTTISASFGLDKGFIQFRISEMLCILPIFMPESVFGLTVGCFISNLILSANPIDVIFGPLATLLGAFLTRLLWHVLISKFPKRLGFLSPLPTVISNTLIIPLVLIFGYGSEASYPFFLLTVGIGEILSAGVLGTVLYYLLKNSKLKI